MGILNHLLISIIHLLLVAIDIFILMILLKLSSYHWKIQTIKPLIACCNPILSECLVHFRKICLSFLGKAYPEKTSLVLMSLCLWIFRIFLTVIL